MSEETYTESIEEMTLESARVLLRLRKRMKRDQTDPSSKYFYTYVLLLQNENVYVGSTNCLYIRLMEHFCDKERSSQWVRMHGPVIRVLEVVKNAKADDETYKTLEYMTLFGWESVRGSSWCKIDLRGPPAALQKFERHRSDFEYMTRDEIGDALKVARDLGDEFLF